VPGWQGLQQSANLNFEKGAIPEIMANHGLISFHGRKEDGTLSQNGSFQAKGGGTVRATVCVCVRLRNAINQKLSLQ
jgi:hypothetical protein